MKKRRLLAAMTAAMCGICVASAPNMAFASGAEIENRDKVIEESLILPEDIAYISETLSTYLWDKETNTPTMDAFIELDKDKKIIVVTDNEEILANIKAFVKEKALDESLIGYRVEDFEAMVPDGYTVETPVTNDELEKLLAVWKSLNTFIYEKGFIDNSAYASLYWGRHSIDCYAKSYAVEYDIKQYMKENGIDESLISIIVAPEAEYRVPTGGNRSYDEVNTIVADEYFSLKKYLSENGVLSNVYLTQKCSEERPDAPYSCVEIYVKTQEDADALKAYMDENYYWSAVVDVTVKSDLSGDTDSTIYNKDYICLSGDSNDDGEFGVADAIKLQRFVLAADTPTEREGAASDLTNDGSVDVFDLVLSRQKLVNN